MKRILFLTILIVLGIFVMPTYAEKPPETEKPPGEVEVINAPDNAVPVEGDVQVTNTVDVNVANTEEGSVPVTVTNPATCNCNAAISGINRQDNAVSAPTPGVPVDLITLIGPGTFISARLAVLGTHNSGNPVRDTTVHLEIDGNDIVLDNLTYLNITQLTGFNFFGVTGNIGSAGAVTIGFPFPVSFQTSLVLSATPVGVISSLEGAVIYGE